MFASNPRWLLYASIFSSEGNKTPRGRVVKTHLIINHLDIPEGLDSGQLL
jgi:hypothetical protein